MTDIINNNQHNDYNIVRKVGSYLLHCNSTTTDYGHHYRSICDLQSSTLLLTIKPIISNTTYQPNDNNKQYIATCELALHILQNKDKFKYLSYNNNNNNNNTLPTNLHSYTSNDWLIAINKVQTNGLSVRYDGSNNLYVMLLNPDISIFNHSCNPNVCIYYDNNNICYIYTIRPIIEQQQLYICYRNDLLHLPTQQRQAILHNIWNFTCKCELCNNIDLTMRIIESDYNGRYIYDNSYITTMIQHMNNLIQQSDLDKPPSDYLDNIDQFLLHNQTLHNAHWIKHKLRNYVMPVLLGGITDTDNDNTTTQQPPSTFIQQWRNKSFKLLTQHIESTVLIEPSLHSSKLQLYNTYIYISTELMKLPYNIVINSLCKIDPSYNKVVNMYANVNQLQNSKDRVCVPALELD